MKYAIIISKKDKAGMNIAKFLEKTNFRDYDANLFYLEDDTILTENLDQEIEADFFIFATRHQSEAGTPSLSVHTPGNWTKANKDHGGQDRKLCINPAFYLKKAFQILHQDCKLENFEITLECTHHGPYLEKPCFFIEIGSKEEDWKNTEAGKTIAKTIIDFLNSKEKSDWIPTILLGGGHYSQAANKIMLRTDYAVGHICPKHMLENLDEEMISQAINKTVPKPKLVLLDWKGLSIHKQKIVDLLENMNLEYERVQRILKRD